jgi:acetyl esterase
MTKPDPRASFPRKAARHLDDLGLPPLRATSERLLARLDPKTEKLTSCTELTARGAAGALPARLYVPHGADASGPGLLYFHGGGFVFGSLAISDALCRRLAHASGARVLSIGYRLAPEAPWPAQHEDALASTRWSFDHASELGMDPARIGLAGDSAGAHMALWTAARLDGATRARALLLLYPLLSLDDAEWAGAPFESLRIVGRISVAYIRRQLGGASPVDFALNDQALASLPPTLLVNGGLDPVRPHAEPFADRLRAAGVEVRTLSFPALIHGSFNLTQVSPAARRAVEATGEAVARLLSR